jgi:hypothetical protein
MRFEVELAAAPADTVKLSVESHSDGAAAGKDAAKLRRGWLGTDKAKDGQRP